MHFELKNKAFYKKTLVMMMPVIFQQLITMGVNFTDNLMVGNFGEIQISAASFSNQFYSLFQFICMGLGGGAIVMSSQFWGRKEIDLMKPVITIAMRFTAVICLAFALVSGFAPAVILRMFTNDIQIVQSGVPYLRILAITFLLSGFSSTATFILRSVSEVKIPLISSAVAFLLNVFFNWIFIFGKFGAPRLEIRGAAIGTLIARSFEFCFIIGYFLLKDRKIGFRFKDLFCSTNGIFKEYMRYSIPVLISDTLLGLSLSLITVIIGHTGREIASANAIANSLVNLISILNMGMGEAAAVVIGQSIGEGAIERTKREGNTYLLLSLLIGVIIIPVLMLLEKPFLSAYQITSETYQMVHWIIMFTCFLMPIQTIAFVLTKGILRGGGDTRFLLLADNGMVWFVSLPLGALAAFVWHWNPLFVYAILRLEYPLKGIVGFIRYCSGKWISIIGNKTN